MKNRMYAVFLALLLIFAVSGCSSNSEKTATENNSSAGEKTEILVLAAASLTDALNELKTQFEKEHGTINVTYSFGSSGKLAQQIEQGAPADVFLSASKKDMDTLQNNSTIKNDTRRNFAENELVLIAPKNSRLSITSFEQLTEERLKQIAIGEPESVPAGRYTKEAFEKLGAWEKLKDRLVLGKDVRQVLTYVESGNAEAGVVYASDAKTSQKVKVVATARPDWHKPIVYPGAIVSSSKHTEEAQAFLNYLTSEQGKQILQKYGFKQSIQSENK